MPVSQEALGQYFLDKSQESIISLLAAAETELEANEIDDLEYKNLFMEVGYINYSVSVLFWVGTGVCHLDELISLFVFEELWCLWCKAIFYGAFIEIHKWLCTWLVFTLGCVWPWYLIVSFLY